MKMVAGLILILLVSGCITQTTKQPGKTADEPIITPAETPGQTPKTTQEQKSELEISIKEFELNKEIFSSREDFNARVIVESNQALEEIEIRVSGIKIGQGSLIYRAEFTELKKGENKFFFHQKTPNCTTGCGGAYPGIYEVKVLVFYNKKILAEQVKEIELTE